VLLIWQADIEVDMFNDNLLLNKKLPSSAVSRQAIEASGRRKPDGVERKKQPLDRFLDLKMSKSDLPRFLCKTLGKAT
jgi:hypothetical protein